MSSFLIWRQDDSKDFHEDQNGGGFALHLILAGGTVSAPQKALNK